MNTVRKHHLVQQFRCFLTISDVAKHLKVLGTLSNNSKDPHPKEAYLTSLKDIDISTYQDENGSLALKYLLMQNIDVHEFLKIKKTISSNLSERKHDVNLHALGLITHFSLRLHMGKGKLPTHRDIEAAKNALSSLCENDNTTNDNTLSMFYFWLRLKQYDLALSTVKDLVIYDEVSALLLMKALMLFDAPITLVSHVCQRVIKFRPRDLLASNLVLFPTPHYRVIKELLVGADSYQSINNVHKLISNLGKISLLPTDIVRIINHLSIPEAVLKQSVLDLHHKNEDRLFLVSSLCLPPSSLLDVLPLVVQKASTLPRDRLLVELVARIVQLQIFELLPLTLKLATKLVSRGKPTVQVYEWISKMLNLYPNLEEEALSESVQQLSPLHKAKLLESCISDNRHTNLIKPIITSSYRDHTLGDTLSCFITAIDNLSTSDYLDDCMIHAFHKLPPQHILSVVRYLRDQSLLSRKQENYWMIVGFDKRGDDQLSGSLFESLYPNDNSVYFSVSDLRNLEVLLTNRSLKTVVSKKCNDLVRWVGKVENYLQRQDHSSLLSECTTLGVLNENNLVHEVASVMGCHFTMLILARIFPHSRDTHELEIVVRQLEHCRNYPHLVTFLTYYGFLLHPQLRSYAELKVKKSGVKMKKRYLDIKQCQMYLYSDLMNRRGNVKWQNLEAVSNSFGWIVLKELLIAYCVVYRDMSFLSNFLERHGHRLSIGEREVLLLLERVLDEDNSDSFKSKE